MTGAERVKRTPEEQQLLDDMVRLRDQEHGDKYADLILIQARMIGDLN